MTRLVANARMYAVTPEARTAWHELFAWLAAAADVPLEIVEHPSPLPLEELWARDDIACVFMCGWPYSEAERRPTAIAAPVPSPARYGGRPVYVSDFVVRADREFRALAETFGGRITWTAAHSHSGLNAPRHHLLRHRTRAGSSPYSAAVGPLITPRRAIEAVLEDEADVAAIDGYVMDLLRRHEPATVRALRVVERTDEAPIPLLVGAPGLEPALALRLTETLCRAHEEPGIRPVLAELLLERFAKVEPAGYAIVADRAQAALAAGFPCLA